MFFKRLFQCVRYSISLYADCAVIIRAVGTVGAGGTIAPPPTDFGRYTNVIRIRGQITPTSLLLVLPSPPGFSDVPMTLSLRCGIMQSNTYIKHDPCKQKMQLSRILQGKASLPMMPSSNRFFGVVFI